MTAFFRPTVLRDTLIARGASREEAERLSDAMAAFEGDVATKADLAGVQQEVALLRRDLDTAKIELRGEIQQQATTLRAEMQQMGAGLRDEMKTLKLWVAIGALGLVGTAVNLGAVTGRMLR
ncbi:hypothetical protein [Roseicella aquatilis]|uniref:DUF1640 domain-containing protein n=1 Tax=Roseicella aquatilis TaxID=2527868 RepID=A0A4R4D2S5_9PROT|nr:hypothetical protein [Roseicella aquatilis]TCZ53171.1 hypothetical protein EXY23_25055 [Roseicella aquatilis]